MGNFWPGGAGSGQAGILAATCCEIYDGGAYKGIVLNAPRSQGIMISWLLIPESRVQFLITSVLSVCEAQLFKGRGMRSMLKLKKNRRGKAGYWQHN